MGERPIVLDSQWESYLYSRVKILEVSWPALSGGELCFERADAHDAVVGGGQEEDVLLLKAQLCGDDDDAGDVDEEDDEGVVRS